MGETRQGDQNNPDGYFENQAIKRLIYREFGKDYLYNVPVFHPVKEKIDTILQKQRCDRPWLYKTGVQYIRCFDEFDVKYVKVKRDPNAILRSYENCHFLDQYSTNEIMSIIKRGLNMMDHIDGPTIDYERVLKRDYGQIKEALEYCGMDFDHDLTDAFVRTPV